VRIGDAGGQQAAAARGVEPQPDEAIDSEQQDAL